MLRQYGDLFDCLIFIMILFFYRENNDFNDVLTGQDEEKHKLNGEKIVEIDRNRAKNSQNREKQTKAGGQRPPAEFDGKEMLTSHPERRPCG